MPLEKSSIQRLQAALGDLHRGLMLFEQEVFKGVSKDQLSRSAWPMMFAAEAMAREIKYAKWVIHRIHREPSKLTDDLSRFLRRLEELKRTVDANEPVNGRGVRDLADTVERLAAEVTDVVAVVAEQTPPQSDLREATSDGDEGPIWNPGTCELSYDDSVVCLSDSKLLTALVDVMARARPAHFIRVLKLINSVWPDQRREPRNVHNLIYELRRKFKSANMNLEIEHGNDGYRFSKPVRVVSEI